MRHTSPAGLVAMLASLVERVSPPVRVKHSYFKGSPGGAASHWRHRSIARTGATIRALI